MHCGQPRVTSASASQSCNDCHTVECGQVSLARCRSMPSATQDVQQLTRPIVTVLTPAGRGAVASISVEGPDPATLVARYFAPLSRKPLESYSDGSIVVGHFSTARGNREELVIGLVHEHRVEIHCHGGKAAVSAIVETLQTSADVRTWDDSNRLNHGDLAAEALNALAQARTERTAGVLLKQFRGSLRGQVVLIADAVKRGQVLEGLQQLDDLLGRATFGHHLTAPWRIVFVGRPNVGKSSLINALLGFRRAIVYDEPGTTRDILSAVTAFEGWPVELLDTAGLRHDGDETEMVGIERTLHTTAHAELVIFVADHSVGWTSDDDAILAALPQTAPRLVVYNKCDVAGPTVNASAPDGLNVSALTSENLAMLASTVIAALIPDPTIEDAAVPCCERQRHLLSAARQAIADGNLPEYRLRRRRPRRLPSLS
jgi:tRNA modification GTPase